MDCTIHACSENKGIDQLRGYREADLRLCFRLSISLVFLCSGSFLIVNMTNFDLTICKLKYDLQITKINPIHNEHNRPINHEKVFGKPIRKLSHFKLKL